MPIETDSDRAVFANPDEFGIAAAYTPAGGGAVEIVGIFDRPSSGVSMNDVVTLDARPTFFVGASDLPLDAAPDAGDRLTVGAETFAVYAIEPDGQGMAMLRLEAAAS